MSTIKVVDELEETAGSDDTAYVPRFHIDLEFAESRGRSMAFLIASRKCAESRRKDSEQTIARSKPTTHIRRIAQHCQKQDDYLPPDTPLKEALFKVLLAEGNREMTADEISTILTGRWALSTNRRDVSSRVIQGLLDSSETYGIVRAPEPEPEPEEGEELSEASQEEAAAEAGEDEGNGAADEAEATGEADSTTAASQPDEAKEG